MLVRYDTPMTPASKPPPPPWAALLTGIDRDDAPGVSALLKQHPDLSNSLNPKETLFNQNILHWLYENDTPLHLAAAGHRTKIVQALLKTGANPNAAHNRRLGRPLHYAADGCPQLPIYNAANQVATIKSLLKAGAEINAQDKTGSTALHRSVRTRCAAAVQCLLDAGANPTLGNTSGSTPFHLAVQNTGRAGSGSTQAHDAQLKIISLFLALKISPDIQDARGKSVRDWATNPKIKALLGN